MSFIIMMIFIVVSFSGPYCQLRKSCECDNIPVINSTNITTQPYYGANNSAVENSLVSIGNWSRTSIRQLSKGEFIIRKFLILKYELRNSYYEAKILLNIRYWKKFW